MDEHENEEQDIDALFEQQPRNPDEPLKPYRLSEGDKEFLRKNKISPDE